MGGTFDDLFRAAMGEPSARPYPYQERLAVEGLPELLRVPTGAGKTAAAVLPWLWRRLQHPDPGVRAAEARWLVFVLPLRSLVEQTEGEVKGWLKGAGLAGAVGVHVLLGGEDRDDDAWRMNPAQPMVFIGTQDMVLSRLLMRGYGESRASWPISFGLLHHGVQFVFDETQLMGPALPTSAQLQGLREVLEGGPSRSMWMSATLAPDEVCTPDHPKLRGVVELSEADRTGGLARRLNAVRRVERVDVPTASAAYPAGVAEVLAARHVVGTRTIAVFNTVERAVAVRTALTKRFGKGGPELVLLHSRFRPPERKTVAERLKAPLDGPGQIVVATQVLEAGVDVSSRVLFSEAALWSSVVQRCGRCNRAGEFESAEVLWAPPPAGRGFAAPYEEADVETAVGVLTSLEGEEVTSTRLQDMPIEPVPVVHPVLRRRDLLQLFDTMPDLSGADVDVSQWIRDSQDTTAQVAWRDWPDGVPAPDEGFPGRQELCPAPVADLKAIVKESPGRLWVVDAVSGEWHRAIARDVRPGAVLLTASGSGWYEPQLGWGHKHREDVTCLAQEKRLTDGMGKDGSTCAGQWVTLNQHLQDVKEGVGRLAAALAPLGLPEAAVEAAELAGFYHDLGKIHPVFTDTMKNSCPDGKEPPGDGPWAKSEHPMVRHKIPFFRHELVSALALLHPDAGALDGRPDRDLIAYLVAAHHGKVRMSVRSMPGEADRTPPTVLGVGPKDTLAAVTLPDGTVLPELALDTSVLFLGGGQDGLPSWTERTAGLLAEWGPFRLGLLEALVRVADWIASACYRTGTPQPAEPPEAPAPMIPAQSGTEKQGVLF